MPERASASGANAGTSSYQFELFGMLPEELQASLGQLNERMPKMRTGDANLRAAIAEALASTALTRDQVAAKMTVSSGHKVTKSMLDSWSAISRPNQMPAFLISHLSSVTGCPRPVQVLANECGLALASRDLLALAVIGQCTVIQQQASEKIAMTMATMRPTWGGGR